MFKTCWSLCSRTSIGSDRGLAWVQHTLYFYHKVYCFNISQTDETILETCMELITSKCRSCSAIVEYHLSIEDGVTRYKSAFMWGDGSSLGAPLPIRSALTCTSRSQHRIPLKGHFSAESGQLKDAISTFCALKGRQ